MKRFINLLAAFFSLVLFFSCEINANNDNSSKNAKLIEIRISQTPKVITYQQGDELILDGMVVDAVYEDGTTKAIKDYTTKPENHSILNTSGIVDIYVYYKDFNAKTFVTVNKNSSSNPEDNQKETTEENPSENPAEIPSVISSGYFWGNWQRMDSGEIYIIDETSVCESSNNSKYKIYAASDDSISTDLGVFQKQSEQVLIKDSIPYFRQGGSNLSYSLKIVGFTDEITNRAASTSDLKKYKGTGKSDRFISFNSEGETDDEGVLHLTAPTANDIQTVTIETDDSVVVVPGLKIRNDGDFMGTIPIVGKNDYSLKITGDIVDSEKNDGYLYGNYYKNYPLTLTIKNISNIDSSPLLCTIEPENPQLTVTSTYDISGIPISSLKSGLTKTIKLNVQFGSIYESYVDTGLKVIIKDSKTGREWSDYIPLRFFKGLMPVTIAARSTEDNPDAALNGFIIYPDGNSQFFSVADKDRKVLYVPTFGNSKNYLLAFSGATVSGELSNSTEMFYTVSICSSTAKNVIISGNDAFYAMQFGENNETEDTSYTIKGEFEAYIADGDIDFFKFEAESSVILLPNELSICEIYYESEFCSVPESVRLASGTILTEDLLPELKKDGWYFAGWYDGENKLKVGDDIKGSVRATARWHKLYNVSFETEKGSAPEAIKIPEGIPYSAEKLPVIEKQGSYKQLGWCLPNSDDVIKELVVKGDTILTAKWVLSECVLNYSTEFGTAPKQKDFAYNSELTEEDLPVLNCEGYTFLGWYINDNLITKGYLLRKNETLTAKWKINSYEVTYYTQFGTAPEPFTTNYGESFKSEQLPVLAETGYTFIGWFVKGDEKETILTTTDTVRKSVQLYAKWKINSYSVSYVNEHGTAPGTIIKTYKSELKKSDLPFLHDDGYNFLGWFIGDTKIQEGYSVRNDIVLTAKWERFVYHVGDIILEDGTRIDKDELDFYTIDENNKPVAVIFSGTDEENDLPAKGIGLYRSLSTIAWASSNSKAYNSKIDELCSEKTDGYDNWIYLSYNYSEDCTSAMLPAFYWANNYGATYCSESLKDKWYLPAVQEFEELYKNKDIINRALEKASGNILSETEFWSSTQCSDENTRATSFYFKDGTKNDYLKTKSLYVRAARNFGNMLSISFDSDGGTVIENQFVKKGYTVVKPSTPKKQGCKFTGWYLNGEEFDFNSKVTDEITLKAHWDGANIPIDVEEYEIGDIVLKDGTVIRNVQETLSAEQIENAVAVIFRVNTRNQKALGIGLKTTSAAWCTSNAKGYTKGYNSWEEICSDDPDGAAEAEKNYPAFYWVNNYSVVAGFTGELAEGWYMPSRSELSLIVDNIAKVNSSLSYLGAPPVSYTWSSTSYDYGRAYYLSESSSYRNYKTASNNVRAIRAFGSPSATYTVTFMSNNVPTKVTVDSGRTCTVPDITNEGYELEGWYLGNDKFDFATPITEPLTLTAKWKLKYNPVKVDEYKFGDILLRDGKVCRNVTSSLSAEQKNDAIAVVFKEASGSEPALGLGLKQQSLIWCSSSAAAYKKDWNSWEEICFYDKTGTSSQKIQEYYPAFYWVNNYADSENITDKNLRNWYMPSYEEANMAYTQKSKLESLITYAGGDKWENFMSSTYYSSYYKTCNKYASGDYWSKTYTGSVRAIIALNAVSVSFDSTQTKAFIKSQTITKGTKCTKPDDPVLDYCTFKGWYNNGTLFDFESPVTSDITLEPRFDYSILPQEVTEYKIGDAVTVDGKVFRNVDATKLPETQKKEIVALIIKNADNKSPALGVGLAQKSCGWANQVFGTYSNCVKTIVSYTGSAKSYVFTGDDNPADNWDYIRSVDEKYTTKEGYYPLWEYVNSYGRIHYAGTKLYEDGWFAPSAEMLQYLSNNFADINTMFSNYNGQILKNELYWSANEGESSLNAVSMNLSTGEITEQEKNKSANIIPMRYFGGKTVRFDSDGGTEIVTKVINSGSNVLEPPLPIKEGGYIFDGWYYNNSPYNFNSLITSDITLKAHWKDSNNVPVEVTEYQIGDVILENGKVLRNIEGTLTEALKKQAVAIIFKPGSNGNKALGVGLIIGKSLVWAAANSTGYSTNFIDIQGTENSGDMDGSDNWDYISSVNSFGAANAIVNYPAFNFVNNYSDYLDSNSEYKNGWYIPSIAELSLFDETKVRQVYWKVMNNSLYGYPFWSSTQVADSAAKAYFIDAAGAYKTESKDSKKNVLVIRKF